MRSNGQQHKFEWKIEIEFICVETDLGGVAYKLNLNGDASIHIKIYSTRKGS